MKRRVCGVILTSALLTWIAASCGGESESGGSSGAGATDASSEAVGGASGSGGGAGAGGGSSGSSGSSGGGGSGGCVASACPDLQIAPGCCRPDGTCGYDGSQIGLGCVTMEEVLAALEAGAGDAGDPTCPDFEVMGYKADGCCLPTGFCGLFDPILTKSCIDPATLPPQYQPDTGPPVPCGSSDASTPTDAGAG